MSFKFYLSTIFLIYSTLLISQNKLEDKLSYAEKIYSSNPDSSFLLANQIEVEIKKTKDYSLYGDVLLLKSKYLILVTDYEKANKEINLAYDYYLSKNDAKNIARTLGLKSILYGRLKDKKLELLYLLKALEIYQKTNDSISQINPLINLSLKYIHSEKYDSALYYLNKQTELLEYFTESNTYYYNQNYGLYYMGIKDYENAEIKLFNAYKIATKNKMVDSRTTITTIIAGFYRKIGKLKLAEDFAQKSIFISDVYKLNYEKSEALEELLLIMEAKKDFVSAYNVQKEINKVNNEIQSYEKIKKIKEVENRLKLSEKENIIIQQNLNIEKEKTKTLASESRNEKLIIFLFIGLLVIIFIAYVNFKTKRLNHTIKIQKLIVESKNKEIMDSINYAKRIQNAILPSDNQIKKLLPETFVLYLPKDVVAGDFYWLVTDSKNDLSANKNGLNSILIAAADCTGHGVPGAMVSVVCNNALNRSVREYGLTSPSKILDKTREIVIKEFEKSGEVVKDGMDISLVALQQAHRADNESESEEITTPHSHSISWCGANNPLWIIRKGAHEIEEYKGDKQPIGEHVQMFPFTEHEIKLGKGDTIYLFTDGYQDQFGGESGKKFKSKALKELFLRTNHLDLEKQKSIIHQTFIDWKGDLEQVDDVCIIGVRI